MIWRKRERWKRVDIAEKRRQCRRDYGSFAKLRDYLIKLMILLDYSSLSLVLSEISNETLLIYFLLLRNLNQFLQLYSPAIISSDRFLFESRLMDLCWFPKRNLNVAQAESIFHTERIELPIQSQLIPPVKFANHYPTLKYTYDLSGA